MIAKKLLYVIAAVILLIMAVYYRHRERRVSSVVFGVVIGLAALFLTNDLGPYLGADIPINIFNVAGSAVLGVPFVVSIAIIDSL